MSQFIRKESPPSFQNYKDYRPFLRLDFRYVCAYCERTEVFLGGEEFFEVDHFRPVSMFPEQRTHYPNLYYACGKCNRHKGSTWPSVNLIESGFRFADPCEEDMYSQHVEETKNGMLRPRTKCGTYTCDHIRLNRPALIQWRREKRQVAGELLELAALAKHLEPISKVVLEDDPLFQHDLVVLESTIARLRLRYAL